PLSRVTKAWSPLRFSPTPLVGVLLVQLDSNVDERGSFIRTFSLDEFAEHGLCISYPEHSIARNSSRGVLRGLHYQVAPYAEVKIIRCSSGRIFDAVVDLRKESASYRHWATFELDAEHPQLLYLPVGVAHGYQTLSDTSEVEYLISERYRPDAARGIRWDSSTLCLPWPISDPIVSERDRTHPPLCE
ncbi:MAG: dTDP-4-dehydrorhamnose 3,5-epimerase family protein, partial [Candidatus Dormibacteria bacterium]